jgi:hypothetical protein
VEYRCDIPQDAGAIVMLSLLVVALIHHLAKALDTRLEVNRPSEGGTQYGTHGRGNANIVQAWIIEPGLLNQVSLPDTSRGAG